MSPTNQISPCLWFDSQAEEAAAFYVSVFPKSKVTNVSLYTEAGKEIHGREPGSVLTVEFELDGQLFTALNGGPVFQFTEAISLQISCDSQQQVDHFWSSLSAGGDPKSQQCGWLKDRYGVSWQVVPSVMGEMLTSKDRPAAERAMAAMMGMKKLDIAGLRRAFDGK